MTKPTVINGRWTLNLPDHRADMPKWGEWERERLASMHANLFVGDVIVDVGSEEGDLPALWAQWGCQVVLIEPDPRVWPNIRAVWEANELPPPLDTFVGFAGPPEASRAPGGFFAYSSRDGRLGPWPVVAYDPVITDHGFCNLNERPDLPSLTIDELRVAGEWPTVDALTIDVEGAELEVLRGAEQSLRDHRPLVWVSVHPDFMRDQYGQTPRDLFEHMARFGYLCALLGYDHEEHWLFWHLDGRHPVWT